MFESPESWNCSERGEIQWQTSRTAARVQAMPCGQQPHRFSGKTKLASMGYLHAFTVQVTCTHRKYKTACCLPSERRHQHKQSPTSPEISAIAAISHETILNWRFGFATLVPQQLSSKAKQSYFLKSQKLGSDHSKDGFQVPPCFTRANRFLRRTGHAFNSS